MTASDLATLLKMSPDEKLDLIEVLWDSLDPDQIPVPQSHAEILDERERDDDPEGGDTWEIVKARLAKRK